MAGRLSAVRWGGVMRGAIVLVIFAVLPTVSTNIFGSFACDEIDTGESFLIKDYSISYDSDLYAR